MKCIKCKENKADILGKLSINGKIKKIFLCYNCSKDVGLNENNTKKADILEYIKNILEDNYPYEKEKISCKFCNTSYKDFLVENRMGCPFCYIYFKKVIVISINEISNNHNTQCPKLTIEKLSNKFTERNIEELYLKAKVYLDYGDIEMAKKIISEIRKYDNC